jgi:nucleoside-diphosphate-sugar epimerase
MPYGSGQRNRLFTDLVRRVREGRIVELVNGGAPIINPIHIDDVAEIFDRALDTPGHVLLNVGGTQALSIREMAEAIGGVLGASPRFEERTRPGEPVRLVGRIERLRLWLGHDPRIGFAAGVARSLR